MNKREIGSAYEQKAVEYLEKHGYSIVGQNYFCRYGEIDIVHLLVPQYLVELYAVLHMKVCYSLL